MAIRKYKCKNFGNCDKADKREIISITDGADFDCPAGKSNCKDTNLDPVVENAGPGKSKLILAALAGFVLVGAIVFALLPPDAPTPDPVPKPPVSEVIQPVAPNEPASNNRCGLTPAKDPDVARLLTYLKQGMRFAGERKFQDAISEFSQARKIDGNFLALNQNIGAAHLGLSKYAEAEEALRAELKLLDCLEPLKASELAPFAYFLEVNEPTPVARTVAQAGRLLDVIRDSRATTHYNLACLYSRQEKKDEGLASLQAAMAAGFSNRKALDTDTDLAFLRKSPEFAGIIKAK